MIKFFRHIRQRLLSENKLSKYFLYAIGEIMLVVIGILIALQINNKNEARKDRAIEVNYLKNLKADLLIELENNEGFSVYRFEKSRSCTNLLNMAIPKTVEDVKEYTDVYEKVFIWHSFVPNNNTFKELLGSGNLSLIKNDSIKNALLELDNFYADISGGEYHMRREYEKFLYDRSVENTLSLAFFNDSEPKYGFPDRLKIEDIPKSKHEQLITDAQWLYEDQTFNNGIRLAMMNNGFLADIHRNMNQNIQKLLELIDEEINK
ncbi:MAG: hypothetical protein KJO39_03390 [Bacteroidia bacterium]|nr:hypothetical protein [Bacteroidia bacterium]NNF32405.1 hypothetical protein [Flavobacteriaceae bacterium]NNJ82409.1 hypothetical protein [Flavobacteriaceae bacterium]NNK55445.1 hypothetical protein [Flavobacteriaceae bacterium]